MKKDLTKYLMKENFTSTVLWTAIISTAVSLVFIILALCIGDTGDGEKLHNFVTLIVMFWSAFVCSIGVAIVGINTSIYMNRSRKTAAKAIIITIIASVLACSAIALAAEGAISLVSNSTGFGYAFRPLLLSGDQAFGIKTVLVSYGFNVLLYYAVSVVSVFLVSISMKFGKWAWIGWWVIYMLIMSTGKSIITSIGSFAKDIFGSTGAAVLAILIITAVVFTAADILLIRKTELKKNALMWTSNARRA